MSAEKMYRFKISKGDHHAVGRWEYPKDGSSYGVKAAQINFMEELIHNFNDSFKPSPTPVEILGKILLAFTGIRKSDVNCVITGRMGPTGKTWLCDRLKEYDFNAFEIGDVCNMGLKCDNDCNFYEISVDDGRVVVVLNRRLEDSQMYDAASLYSKSMLNSIYGATGGYTHPGLYRPYTLAEATPYERFNWPNRFPRIKDVLFNDPATIVFWNDGTKTVVKTQGDEKYDPEKGLAMAISKCMLGNERDYYNTFLKWMKKYEKKHKPVDDGRVSFSEAIDNVNKTLKDLTKRVKKAKDGDTNER